MKKKILYGFLCLLLFILLGGFLYYCQREDGKQIQNNRMLRESLTGSEQSVTDNEGSTANNGADQETQAEAEDSEVKNEDGSAENTDEKSDDAVPAAAAEDVMPLISFRGDSFQKEEEIQDSGIGAALKKIFEENQITMEISDYSLYKAGSMAQLRLAGVDEEKIDEYLKRHTDNSEDIRLSIYETKVRAAEDMDLQRDDQKGIPVICMGYYGGWYNDPEELIAQIKDVLGTYSQQEQYLIVGLYPDVKVDKEVYKQKMTEAWGDHYLQLDEEISHSPSTKQGKKDIAEALFEKLQALGYLKAGE